MSSLKSQIMADMKTAMRDKDSNRLESIRMLRAAIQRKEVDDRVELDDDAVSAIIQKQIKQSQDAANQFVDGDREDLAAKEQQHISNLQHYLPEPLSESEVDSIIADAIAQAGAASMKDMGKVMGAVKSKVQGRADMGSVSNKIKALLTG